MLVGILSVYLITEVLGEKMYKMVTHEIMEDMVYGVFLYSMIIILCLLAGFVINNIVTSTVKYFFATKLYLTIRNMFFLV